MFLAVLAVKGEVVIIDPKDDLPDEGFHFSFDKKSGPLAISLLGVCE